MVEAPRRRFSRHERKQLKKQSKPTSPADGQDTPRHVEGADESAPKAKRRKKKKSEDAAAAESGGGGAPSADTQGERPRKRRLADSDAGEGAAKTSLRAARIALRKQRAAAASGGRVTKSFLQAAKRAQKKERAAALADSDAGGKASKRSLRAARKAQEKERTAAAPARELSPAATELLRSLEKGTKGTLSDRLNPKHSCYDRALKRKWKSFTKGERAAIVAGDQNRLQARAATDISHPFPTKEDDHVETALEAYRDIAPILKYLAKWLNKEPPELQIYDPFYCAGAAAVHLKELGFESVYHRCEDFYAVQREARVPVHDVLVTNPPYSGNHVERLLRWSRTNGKPFFLLMPNHFCVKTFYKPALGNAAKVLYLFPRKRYKYWTPRGLRAREKVQTQHSGAGGYRTSPFVSFWHIDLSPIIAASKLKSWWNSRPRGKHAGTLCSYEDLPPVAFDVS